MQLKEVYMNFGRIIGLVVVVIGIASMIFANYIRNRLYDAEGQITDAKKKIKQGDQLFSFNPVAKEIGQGFTSGAKEKVSEAEATVAEYYRIAAWSHNGGIALIVIGAGIVVFCRKKSKK